jgi:checkpoint serine/threonine-protein kinase
LASFQSVSQAQIPPQIVTSNYADIQQVINPKTGKIERVFVNLEAIYPNPNDPFEEMSFEELRALSRGWLRKDWAAESKQRSSNQPRVATIEQSSPLNTADEPANDSLADGNEQNLEIQDNLKGLGGIPAVEDGSRAGRSGRPRKTKTMEVKVETQTSKDLHEMATCTS